MEKRIQEIIARCREIDTAQDEIERSAELENSGQFSQEQRESYATLKGEFDALIAEKLQLEKDAEMRASRAGRAELLQPAVLPRRAAAAAAAPAAQIVKTVPGQQVDPNTADNGEARVRFKIPARALRVGSPRNFTGVIDGMNGNERAYRFGMWALAKLAQDLPGRYNFRQAREFVSNYMGDVLNTAHGETDGTTGGNVLVPEEFSSDLIVLRERYGIVRQLFGREAMTSDTKHIPKRLTGLTAYFVAENAAATESNMTWQDVQLIAKDLVCLSRMSAQLSMDAVISIGDTLAGEMSYAFSNKEDLCGFVGDGTSTYAGIYGCTKQLDDVDNAGTDSLGKVIQGSSNTWSAMVLADFNKVVSVLPQFADTPNTTWVAHKTFYAQVMQKLELAAGGVTANEVSVGDRRPRPLFLGYPVTFSQVMPSATATTGVMCLLGDFSLGAVFGDRMQTSIAFSEHASVNSESVFERNQIAIRGTERFDLNVHGCGTASAAGPIVGLATA